MKTFNVKRIEKDFDITENPIAAPFEQAESTGPFRFPWNEAALAEHHTEAKFLYSDSNLYVYFRAEDTFFYWTVEERNGLVFHDDCLEMFIMPVHMRNKKYYGYEVNIFGAMLDYYTLVDEEGELTFDYEWDSKTEIRIEKEEGRQWEMVLKLPFSDMESKTPVSGEEWTVTLNRVDVVEAEEEDKKTVYSTTADFPEDKVSFHQPEYFTNLRFE